MEKQNEKTDNPLQALQQLKKTSYRKRADKGVEGVTK